MMSEIASAIAICTLFGTSLVFCYKFCELFLNKVKGE